MNRVFAAFGAAVQVGVMVTHATDPGRPNWYVLGGVFGLALFLCLATAGAGRSK